MATDALKQTAGPTPLDLRDRLQSQGSLFVKFGHYLGAHPDLVDDAYIDALIALPDTAAASIPPEVVRDILGRGWGAPPERKLRSISIEPYTSRILDQLHVATLEEDGSPAIVRILRPEARLLLDEISKERSRLEAIIELCCPSGLASPAPVIAGFSIWLADQVDLSLERPYRGRDSERNGQAGSDSLSDLCTPEIVVTRDAPRRPLTDGLQSPEGDAGTIIRLAFKQIFTRRRAHDVPVASNIGIPTGEPADWISRGPYRPLTAIELEDIRALWTGLHAHDEASVLRAVRRSLEHDDKGKWEALELDILSEMRRNVAARPGSKAAAGRGGHAADDMLLSILRAVRETGSTMADGPLSAHRLLIISYRIARLLSPGSEPERAGRRRLATLDVEDALDSLDAEQVSKFAVDLLLLLRDAPGRLNQITADLAEGTLGVALTLDETRKTAEAWNRRARLIATAVVSLGPFFLLGQVGSETVLGVPLSVVLCLALFFLFAWMALQWRNLK